MNKIFLTSNIGDLVSERKREEKKMKVKLSLAEVKELTKNHKCTETETCFLLHMQSKYDPKLCFVMDKYFQLDGDADPINPIEYFTDTKVTDGMNIDFNGITAFMFGDYWVSKKGTKCFKIKPPIEAKHILIRIDWGGSFNKTRGLDINTIKDIPEVLYYHKASSNGGGTGYDYLVVPVGFSKSLYDEEFDGENVSSDNDDETINDYPNKFQKYLEGRFNEYDKKLKDLLPTRIDEITQCRNKYLTELQLAQYHLVDICASRIIFDKPATYIYIRRLYFVIAGKKFFYTEENIKEFREIYKMYQ